MIDNFGLEDMLSGLRRPATTPTTELGSFRSCCPLVKERPFSWIQPEAGTATCQQRDWACAGVMSIVKSHEAADAFAGVA